MSKLIAYVAATLVGALVLWLAGYGIDVPDEIREVLVTAFTAAGFLVYWMIYAKFKQLEQQYKPPREPRSDDSRYLQDGHARLDFVAAVGVGCALVMTLATGCATLQSNSPIMQSAVQTATMAVLSENPEKREERARIVVEMVDYAQDLVDVTGPSVPELKAAVMARLDEREMPPERKLLAMNLINLIDAYLQQSVASGELNPEQRVTVNRVLGWVEEAAKVYIP